MRTNDRRVRRIAWGLGIATVSAVTAFGVASWQAQAAPTPAPPDAAAPLRVSDPRPVAENAAGAGRDPLTATERDRSRTAALTTGITGTPTDVTGAAGPEYLTTDLQSGAAGRHAQVYLYDYSTDRLIKQVVDLGTGRVTGTYAATGMQPPASAREVDRAFGLLLADPLGGRFTDEYRKATGKAYTGRDQIEVRAHVYTARPADSGAEKCGAHRCLSLVVQTRDTGNFLELNDLIIDLSGRTVARLT